MKQLNDINPNLSKILPRIFFSLIPVLLLSFFLSSELLSNTSAENLSVRVQSTDYYANIEANDLSLEIDTTPTGAFASTSDEVTVKTNSASGYKLYLSMNNNNTNGNRLYQDGSSSSPNYIAPTSERGDALDLNSWGFSTDNTKWLSVPLQGNEKVIKTSSPEPFISGDITEISYGVKANTSIANGTYEGVVKYTAVIDASNTSAGYANVVSQTTGGNYTENPAGGETLTITTSLATTMSSIGTVRVFVGGKDCTNVQTSTNTGVLVITCTAPAAGFGAQPVDVDVEKFNKVYSGTFNYNKTFWNISYMQQMDQNVCNYVYTPGYTSTSTSANNFITDKSNYTATADGTSQIPQRTLTDSRDGKTYIIRKLADGNCWMVQNLDLNLTAGTVYTSDNTDLNTKNKWTISQTTITSATTYVESNIERSYDPGGYWNTGYNGKTTTQPSDATDAKTKHIGNYYNYYVATADYTGTSGNAPDSICPKGWQLPYSTGNKSWQNLVVTVYRRSPPSWYNVPTNLLYSGYYSFASNNWSWGGDLEYLTATATDSTTATIAFSWYNVGSFMTSGAARYATGYTIRCVSR